MGYSISFQGLRTIAAVTSDHRDIRRAVTDARRAWGRVEPVQNSGSVTKPGTAARFEPSLN